jgi:hypothetical protein
MAELMEFCWADQAGIVSVVSGGAVRDGFADYYRETRPNRIRKSIGINRAGLTYF